MKKLKSFRKQIGTDLLISISNKICEINSAQSEILLNFGVNTESMKAWKRLQRAKEMQNHKKRIVEKLFKLKYWK